MRGFAIALLAGLLAMTAQPAQAICAVGEEGGCSRLSHSLDLEVSGDCPEAASLCIIDRDGNLSQSPNDADYGIVVRNAAGSAITFEFFAIGFYDQNGEPVTGDRVAARLLATLEVAAGEAARLEDVDVPGDVSRIRVQALSADGRQAEADAELSNVRILMMQPGDGPVDEGSGEAPGEKSGKDAPAVSLALLAVACAAAVLLARRLA